MSHLRHPKLIPELVCSDISQSLEFYVELLGFKIQYQRKEDGFAMLEHQGAFIMLDQNNIGRTWLSRELETPFGRGINLQIATDNVDELYQRVKQAKANVFLEMEEKWYRADDVFLGNRQFIVLDPDGYMLRFFKDLGKRTEI